MSSHNRHNWEPHLARMVEEYKSEKSIPRIHKSLLSSQSSFHASEKQLYNKFNTLGLPTDKTDRASTKQALEEGRWNSSISGINSFGNSVVQGIMWKTEDIFCQSSDMQPSLTGTVLPVRTSPLQNANVNAQSSFPTPGTVSWEFDVRPNHSQAHLNNNLYVFNNISSDAYTHSAVYGEDNGSINQSSYGNGTFFDDSIMDVEPQVTGTFNNDTYVHPSQWQSQSEFHTAAQPIANLGSGHKRPITDAGLMTTTEWQITRPPPSTVTSIPEDLVLDSNKNDQQRTGMKCFRKHVEDSIERKRAAQLRITRSATPDKRLSTSTSGSWRDSGYGSSGRTTPMFGHIEDVASDPNSLEEFGRLHRIPCQLHEPKPEDPFKEVFTCPDCHLSAIHSLCWSAKYMTLEKFEAKLTGYSPVEVGAIDDAGNSALHYAAAGGAGPEHFLALKDAGADIWALNSAGQLFLNCLPPPTSPKEMSEASFELFKMSLVTLLNMFDIKGGLRWRDNEGATIKLYAIVAQIQDKVMREKTLDIVNTIGHRFLFSDQLPGSATDAQISVDQYPTSHGSANGPRTTPSRQDKADEILQHAARNPYYVDPSTGDNALHALAQIKLPGKVPGKGSLQPQIKQYVDSDADLNLLNHKKESPLIAMIRERPLMEHPFMDIETDETGATMSRYLDTLLWKDEQKRIPNRINVNLKNREGATALCYAAILARPDSVRSLIEAGANVNVRINVDGENISILRATNRARINLQMEASNEYIKLKLHQYDNVISYLEHHNAVDDPSLAKERALSHFSIKTMPI